MPARLAAKRQCLLSCKVRFLVIGIVTNRGYYFLELRYVGFLNVVFDLYNFGFHIKFGVNDPFGLIESGFNAVLAIGTQRIGLDSNERRFLCKNWGTKEH